MERDLSFILTHLGENREDGYHAVVPPIVQSGNFTYPSVQAMREVVQREMERPLYTRGFNPTVGVLREKIAALEGAEDALVFSSGSAAIAAAVLSFVRSFITQYTSPDPFHANAYADKVLELGTGNFAQLYGEMMNEVVIQVAQAEPGFGTVQELGIERWNPNGSATVVAVANMTTKMPDGKKIESGSRWEVTAVKEGGQWKVSDLIQVL